MLKKFIFIIFLSLFLASSLYAAPTQILWDNVWYEYRFYDDNYTNPPPAREYTAISADIILGGFQPGDNPSTTSSFVGYDSTSWLLNFSGPSFGGYEYFRNIAISTNPLIPVPPGDWEKTYNFWVQGTSLTSSRTIPSESFGGLGFAIPTFIDDWNLSWNVVSPFNTEGTMRYRIRLQDLNPLGNPIGPFLFDSPSLTGTSYTMPWNTIPLDEFALRIEAREYFTSDFSDFINRSTYYTTVTNPIPEPATMLLLGSGLIGLAGYGRRKLFKR